MIPDTLIEYIWWLTIIRTVEDLVFPKFCDQKKKAASIMPLLVCNVMTSFKTFESEITSATMSSI